MARLLFCPNMAQFSVLNNEWNHVGVSVEYQACIEAEQVVMKTFINSLVLFAFITLASATFAEYESR